MLTKEERLYDIYIQDGGSDECHRHGMSGNCGNKCPIFGERDGCRDDYLLQLEEIENESE